MAKENVSTFKYDDIPKRSYHFFEDMKNKKEFCDVAFKIGNECISAHRVIVSAVIPYFRDILSNKSAQGEKEAISVPDIEPCAFKCLIDFAYSYEVKIDTENVRNLLAAACYLGVEEVREACCDFLANSLEHENVLNIRELANNFNCPEFVKCVDCYVKENFCEISQRNDFLNYPFGFIKEILGRDDLFVDDEKQVLDAVLKWVQDSPEDRGPVLPELMCKIRMPLLEHRYLAEIVRREELIRTSVLCRDLLDEARNYNLFPEMRENPCSFRTEPRRSVVATGAGKKRDKRCMYKLEAELKYTVLHFDFEKEIWHTKESFVFRENQGSAAELHNKIYFFVWGDTLQYDQATNRYNMLSAIPTPRIFTGAVSLKNRIYVCGGNVGRIASNAVECFDPEKDEWTKVRSMPTSRWAPSVVTLAEYIYVLGGKDGSSVYDCVERYDPVTDKWRSVSPMLTKRSYAGAAALNGKIYICGGSPFTMRMMNVTAIAEVYDPIRNTWKFISPMKTARCEFTLLSCRGKLFAVDGEDDKGTSVYNFHSYDPEADKWTFGHSTDKTHFSSGAVVM